MDMGPAFAKSVRQPGHAPQAVICIDPFHAVKLVGEALDVVRREVWNEMRQLPDPAAAKKFKGARWSLLKNPENLTDDQAATAAATAIRAHVLTTRPDMRASSPRAVSPSPQRSPPAAKAATASPPTPDPSPVSRGRTRPPRAR
jgi:transposase